MALSCGQMDQPEYQKRGKNRHKIEWKLIRWTCFRAGMCARQSVCVVLMHDFKKKKKLPLISCPCTHQGYSLELRLHFCGLPEHVVLQSIIGNA